MGAANWSNCNCSELGHPIDAVFRVIVSVLVRPCEGCD